MKELEIDPSLKMGRLQTLSSNSEGMSALLEIHVVGNADTLKFLNGSEPDVDLNQTLLFLIPKSQNLTVTPRIFPNDNMCQSWLIYVYI